MKHLTLFIIITFLFSGVLYGTICANYSPCAYEGGCAKSSNQSIVQSSGSQINFLVVIGAGYFLDSHSNFQLFLNKVELSELYGLNYDDLNGILDAAISNMVSAKTTYYALKTVAASTPYNQSVIEGLKAFDYDGFFYGRNLNPFVFKSVKAFLYNGDVTGSYSEMFSNKSLLLVKLLFVKSFVAKGNIPPISELWSLNQLYSNSLLFGQYIAMIFSSVI
jgi:hypothetical protein